MVKHYGDAAFVNLNINSYVPEAARRYASYVSHNIKKQIELAADGNEVSFDHLIELLDWPPLGRIIEQFFQSQALLALLEEPARHRLVLVASLIDSVAEKLLAADITYGEFAKLLQHEEKFVALLNHLAPADTPSAVEKRERYSRSFAAIALRKQQRDRYLQQRKRLGIFVDQFKNFKEIGTESRYSATC